MRAHRHRLQLLPQPALPKVPEPAPAKAGGAAAKDWLAARETDLLPVGYFHLVFTLPAEIAPIAYQNKAVVYNLLFRTAAETLLTIAPTGQARGLKAHDPRHLASMISASWSNGLLDPSS